MDEFKVEDVEKAVEAILAKLPPQEARRGRRPIAVVLGGQPGAGKSALQDIAKQTIPKAFPTSPNFFCIGVSGASS